MFTKTRTAVFALPLVFACAEPESTPPDAPQTALQIFSWWTAPGEAEALDALVSAHRAQYPDVSISNLVVANVGQDVEQSLRLLLVGGEGVPADPPDVMQWNVDSYKTKWIDAGVKLEPLDSVFAEEGWAGKFRPDVLADCTIDGHVVALPVGMHRENTLMYNRQVLVDTGASAPEDWATFVASCDQVTSSGKTCVALTQEGWVLNILLRNVAIMTLGAEAFHTYFTGQGPRDDAAIAQIAINFEIVLDRYIGGRANLRASGWDEAAKDLFRGTHAFFLHGDWAVGLFKTLGWNDQDFAAVSTPGASSLFVYGADAFMLPQGADDLAARLDVIRVWGSAATLADFSSAKGSSAPRTDVTLTSDPVAAAIYDDLQSATLVMPIPPNRPADAILQGFFAGTVDKAALVEAIRDAAYPL